MLQLLQRNPVPKPMVPVLPNLTEYKKEAELIGLTVPNLAKWEFIGELLEAGCEFYDQDKVARFLVMEAEKLGKSWVWKPLRLIDAGKIVEREHSPTFSLFSNRPLKYSGPEGCRECRSRTGHGLHTESVYDRAVPIEAIRLVREMEMKLPGTRFYVSDYDDIRPDPFLLAYRTHEASAVIYHWDEPGYKK